MTYPLFDECIGALGNQAKVLSCNETSDVFKSITSNFKFTSWGRVDWRGKGKKVESLANIMFNLKLSNERVYVIWGSAEVFGVESDFDCVGKNCDDVFAVDFITYLYFIKIGLLIECHSFDGMTYAYAEK